MPIVMELLGVADEVTEDVILALLQIHEYQQKAQGA